MAGPIGTIVPVIDGRSGGTPFGALTASVAHDTGGTAGVVSTAPAPSAKDGSRSDFMDDERGLGSNTGASTSAGPVRDDDARRSPSRRRSSCGSALFALVALLSGCASGERMIRLSPFSADEPSAKRVNLWPLWYADGARNAVIWPLIDWDDRGFAARPFAARDGDQLDLLWPLAHVELDDGSFWALTAYHDVGDDLHGLFPLAGWGQLNYVGPVWWTLERDRRIAAGADPGAEPNEVDGYGLFPLLWRDLDHDTTVVFPLWWDLRDSFALAPFWWHDRNSDSRVLFPFWWEFATQDGSERSRTLFPLFHWAQDAAHRRLVTPLGGRGWSADGSIEFTNVLGPLWHRSSYGPDDSYTAFLWPLWTDERLGRSRETSLFPLWSRAVDPDRALDETCVLLGMGRHRVDEAGESWRAWPLFATSNHASHESFFDWFTLVGHRRHETSSQFQFGTALVFELDRWDLPSTAAPAAATAAAPAVAAVAGDTSWQAHVAALLSFGHDASPPLNDAVLAALEAAPDASAATDHAGFLFDWFLAEWTTLEGPALPPTTVARHTRIPLLFEHERDPSRNEWDTLLWCVHSKECPHEKRFVAGWGLYRKVERGGRVTRDLFPFITWDDDAAADASEFSFLWRLWHRERRGERTGGHFLFIPWGDDFG